MSDSKLNLRQIQLEELDMLKKLDEFFEKNGIIYYLFGGTLLGAVRHKGFIPWDDDIDLAIPREYYDKLIEVIKKNDFKLDHNLLFEGFELENGKFPFIKLINKEIRIEENVNVDKYLWIDIFPLDYIPDDKKQERYLKHAYIKHEIITLKMMKYKDVFKSSKTIKTRIIKLILWPIVSLFNTRHFTSSYIQYCKKYYLKSNTVGNVIWCLNSKEGLPKNILKTTKVKFENYEFPCFENYDFYLSKIYGNYMELPPENKRYTHSFDAYKK